MRKLILTIMLAGGVLAGTAMPVLATHEHQLVTPGTTVDPIAIGSTSNDGAACHQFHDNVHTGIPGYFAIGNDKLGGDGQPNNPVTITGDPAIACPP